MVLMDIKVKKGKQSIGKNESSVHWTTFGQITEKAKKQHFSGY